MLPPLPPPTRGSVVALPPRRMAPATLSGLAWHPPGHWELDATERSWLLDGGSLTGRLRAQGRDFSLRLQGERWLADAEVPSGLGGGPYRERQVLLCLDRQPWVWGRTLIPAASLQACPALGTLGSQPLGEHLFRQPGLLREPFELADFSASAAFCRALGRWGVAGRRPLWGRRSLVRFGGSPLLICEVFLPACPIYEEGDHDAGDA